MAGPGFSVTELIQAISKGKQIYDAFHDEYESAPARIKDLVDTSNYLADVLQDVQSLLDQYGDVYPQEANFGRKLHEVDAFIEKYKTLKREYGQSTGTQAFGARVRQTWQQTWQTTQYAFDDQRARDLKDSLQLEIQKLLLFILVFALRRTVPVNRTVASHQAASPARIQRLASRTTRTTDTQGPFAVEAPYPDQDSEDSFEGLFRRLLSVRYIHDREMSLAVRQNREPNLEHVHQNLESVWHSLNIRAGLAQRDGRVPPLPRPRLLEAPSQNYNDIIVNTANPSIHTSIQSGPRLQSPLLPPRRRLSSNLSSSSRTSTRQGSVSDLSSIFPRSSTTVTTPISAITRNRRTPAPSLNIGDSVLPTCTATINLPIPHTSHLRTLFLRDWELQASDNGNVLAWIGEPNLETLEHYLPLDFFPRTLHSSHEEEAMHVNFYEPHRMVLTNEEATLFNQTHDADYVFTTAERRKLFQGDLRGKDLVETFDFNTIWSERRPKKYGEATFQDLKIWQDRHHPYRHTISFFASSTVNRVLEFPVLSFQPQFSERAFEKSVELSFVRKPEGSGGVSEASVERRRTSIFSRRSTSSEAGSGIFSQSPPSVGTSLHIAPTFTSTSDGQLPHDELSDRLKRLKIQFTSKKDYELFIKLFKEAYRTDKVPAHSPIEHPVSQTAHYEEFFELEGSSPMPSELSGSYPASEMSADPPTRRSSSISSPAVLPDHPWGRSPGDFTSRR